MSPNLPSQKPGADAAAQAATGPAPMTHAQRSTLKELSAAAGQPFHADLSKTEAQQQIDALQHKTGRHAAAEPVGDDSVISTAGEEDPGAALDVQEPAPNPPTSAAGLSRAA